MQIIGRVKKTMVNKVFTLSGVTRHLVWLWLVVVIAGCDSNADKLKLESVSGTVTIDGKPCPSVSVTFIPTGTTRGRGASGSTDEAGKYELKAASGEKGAPAGKYQVSVSKLVKSDGSIYNSEEERGSADSLVFPVEYSSGPGRRMLTASVSDGENNIDFPLSSRNAPPVFLRQ